MIDIALTLKVLKLIERHEHLEKALVMIAGRTEKTGQGQAAAKDKALLDALENRWKRRLCSRGEGGYNKN